MKTNLSSSILLLALFSLPALAHDSTPDADANVEEAGVEVIDEGANKCNRENYNNCITSECTTGPGGITQQCRNHCKRLTGC